MASFIRKLGKDDLDFFIGHNEGASTSPRACTDDDKRGSNYNLSKRPPLLAETEDGIDDSKHDALR